MQIPSLGVFAIIVCLVEEFTRHIVSQQNMQLCIALVNAIHCTLHCKRHWGGGGGGGGVEGSVMDEEMKLVKGRKMEADSYHMDKAWVSQRDE